MEITSLLEAFFQKYSYDFRHYSEAHIRRRIMKKMNMSGFDDIDQMQSKLLTDEVFASEFLQDLSITVTEMFRDPGFYQSFRENVIPILKTYPFVKIWHAGCATGEEVYSVAILLQEEGLYDRTTIYATDFNQQALSQAKEGIFSSKVMKEYAANYQLSGGKGVGSTFYFTLPYNAEPEEKKVVGKIVPAQDEKVQIKKLKLLIAEDDETSEMLIAIDVEKISKEILKARKGFEAVEVCRNNR